MRADLKLVTAGLVAGLVLGGCGGDEDGPPEIKVDRLPEKGEHVGKLPQGWTVERNQAQGFSLGAPPGWRSGGDCLRGGAKAGPLTILCSPDKLVTLSITADRTDDALELTAEEFAVQTAESLAKSYDGLKQKPPKPVKGHYEGASIKASGRAAATGVDQDVEVVVLRREGAATFTALIAANADKPTGPAKELADRALSTLRSRPVQAPSGGPPTD